MIRPLQLSAIAQQLPAGLAAQVMGDDALCDQFSTDTRTLEAGQVFVALRGDRFDGHDHLQAAVNKGAAALVVEAGSSTLTAPQLVVNNTLAALGEIAAINRNAFSGPLIGITGSSGKTTVRTMINEILSVNGSVLSTLGNLNNHIGVPLTLLRLQASHRYAVIEMGASGRGEIADLCRIARPTLTLINNILPAHIQGFGSLEGVALAKAEIYQGLASDGIALVNLDEPYAAQWISDLQGRPCYGFALENPAADCYATAIRPFADHSLFDLVVQGQSISVRLNISGLHHIRNATAAALAAVQCGADLQAVQRGLQTFRPVAGRMVTQKGIHGCTVIDDSYNANPGSAKAAIDALALYQGIRVLVMGDMGELGDESDALHAEVGEHAMQQQIDFIFSQGNASRFVSEVAGAQGRHYQDQQQLINDLKNFADEKTVFLIKGSRSARTDVIAAALISFDSCGDMH